MRRQVHCICENMNRTYVSRFRAVPRWGQVYCWAHPSLCPSGGLCIRPRGALLSSGSGCWGAVRAGPRVGCRYEHVSPCAHGSNRAAGQVGVRRSHTWPETWRLDTGIPAGECRLCVCVCTRVCMRALASSNACVGAGSWHSPCPSKSPHPRPACSWPQLINHEAEWLPAYQVP